MDALRKIISSWLRRGQVTILVAGIIVIFLLLFLVVGIDFARLYYVRGELQNAADAAALAGAKQLDGTDAAAQTAARQAAWQYACRNKAAGENVYVVTEGGGNCDSPPPAGLNTNNVWSSTDVNASGDIVVGNWNGTAFTAADPNNPAIGRPINALQVIARRTGTAADDGVRMGNNPVGLLFGRLVGWSTMDVIRTAIASRQPLKTPGISLCTRSCGITGFFIANTDTSSDQTFGMAWTEFDCGASVNSNDVTDFIWSRKMPPSPLCGKCLTTSNGTSPINVFYTAFIDKNYDAANKTFDANGNVTGWTVAVPIIDFKCGSSDASCNRTVAGTSQSCPPGVQGMGTNEPSNVATMAVINISCVAGAPGQTGGCGQPSNEKGILVSSNQCLSTCPLTLPLGKAVALVK